MYRRWLAYAGILALVLAVVMMTAAPAAAQRFGGFGLGVGRGYSGSGLGYGYNSFGYSPYSSGYYGNWNNGWNNTWGNNYSSPGWSNWGYGTNYNSFGYTPNYYSSGWGNNWSSPGTAYYGNNFYGAGTMPAQGSTSFYSADHMYDLSKVPTTAALFHVHVPPDAKISFSGHDTKETGHHREFVTPALEENQTYFYNIRATWNEGGKNVEQSRKVLVRPGDRIRIDFNRDMTVVEEMTPNHDRMRSQSGYEGTDQQFRNNQNNQNRSNEIVPAPTDRNDLNRNDLNRTDSNLNRTDVPRTTDTDNLNRPSNTTTPQSNQGATPTPRGSTPNNPSTPK